MEDTVDQFQAVLQNKYGDEFMDFVSQTKTAKPSEDDYWLNSYRDGPNL